MFCKNPVWCRSQENLDVLPAALRNFRLYFCWLLPISLEFIFHIQKRVFYQRKRKIFNTLVLLNILGTKTGKVLLFSLTYLIEKFPPVIFIFSESPQNPYWELPLGNRNSHANEVNRLLSLPKFHQSLILESQKQWTFPSAFSSLMVSPEF